MTIDTQTNAPSLRDLLSKIRLAQPTLALETHEFLYLAAMSLWDQPDDDYLVIHIGFQEEVCNEIFSYVDSWLGREEGNANVRWSNFLKRSLDQGLLMQAGISLNERNGLYRLTQLAQDLLKPFTADPLAHQETLGHRYIRMEIQLSELIMLEAESDEDWQAQVKSAIPSFSDLVRGINQNQEQLIVGFSQRRQEVQEMQGRGVGEQTDMLLKLVIDIASQISDLRNVVFSGAEKVLYQINELTEKAYSHHAPTPLIRALEQLHQELDAIREFSTRALVELAEFFQRLLQTIRLQVSLNQNANMSLLLECAVASYVDMPWSLNLLESQRMVELRDWEPPPPPEDNTLPRLEQEFDIVRDTPSSLLETLAKDMCQRILAKGQEVDITDVARRVLANEKFIEADRYRLLFFVVNQLLNQGRLSRNTSSPNWIRLLDDQAVEIEQQWLLP